MPEPNLSAALVRILQGADTPRRPVGAGFFASTRHLLTCAHVVADALGLPRQMTTAPVEPVALDVPLVAGAVPLAARVMEWYPVKEEAVVGEVEDIAVLELAPDRSLPPGAQPAPLVVLKPNALFDRPVRLCGFPEGLDEGDWISGQLQGPTATGWVQLDPDLGRRGVAPGFSGTAVWDKQENAVVGMIVSTQTRAGVLSAYLIPVASLSKAWPDLDRHSRPPNPYRGLAAFREQDQEFFLGRQADSADLQDKVAHHPLVLLVGASGGGKSSLVFAGLLPTLRREERWRVVSCRPGYPSKNPFGNLALGLLPLLYADPKQQADQLDRYEVDLSSGKTQLHRLLQIVPQSQPDQRLLLVIDQFEELYTQGLPPASRQRFLDQLLQTVQAQGTPPAVTVLLTLRADFLGQVLDYQPFNEALSQDSYPKKILAPLSLDALRVVIAEPARQLGVELEPGLLERILQDLGPEPGKKLPLLEFALTQLWERQAQRTLSHQAYEAIGGVDRALARHADAVLQAAKNQQERIRRIFVQLVQPGAGTEDTRHVATREQVGAENWPLVAELASQRLVLTGRTEQGQDTVEVVHEALIQHWEPLRQWMSTYREFRAWQERLRQALAVWRESGEADDELLRGARLAEAEERLHQQAEELSPTERAYIEASLQRRARAVAIRQRNRRRIMTGLTAGLVVALVLTGLAAWQWREAIKQRNLALARQLSAQAALRLDNTGVGLMQSALLATESLQRDLTPSASLTWALTMDLMPRHPPIRLTHEDRVESVVFGPDGQRLATASADKTARVWDAASGRELARLVHADGVWSVAFSPDGQRLATASGDAARVWDAASGRELARLAHEDTVSSVAFSPDGRRLATTSENKTARVWLW